MKKLLFRVFVYLVVLVSLTYGYFWIQAKNALDAFLLNQPFDGDFNYSRLSLDLDGNVYLKNATFTLESGVEAFSVDQIEIELTSIFDLLSAEEHILYQEYPSRVSLSFIGGRSTQLKDFFNLFNVKVAADQARWIYPQICQQQIELIPKVFSFNLNVDFEIHNTSDINMVDFHFSSLELFDLLGKFKINNFSDANNDGNFLSDLALSFKDLAVLQKNTQRCLTAHQLDQTSFSQRVSQQFKQLEIDYGLSTMPSALLAWQNFIYIPDQIDLVFDLPSGKKYSQIPLKPIQNLQKNIGLKIFLNKKTVGNVFKAEGLPIKPRVEQTSSNLPDVRQANLTTNLRPNKKSLKGYLGAKVVLQLKNGKSVIGYIENVGWNSLEISQRKFKGKSQLPFKYSKIRNIKLLRMN